MTAGTVLLWRHGQTEWNRVRRLQGQSDVELDPTGVEQAARAAEVLVRSRPTAIVSSDLVRAARTAQALVDLTGLTAVLDTRLRERSFGVWEGLDREQIEAGWPEEFRVWNGNGQPDGVGLEPRGDVGARVAAAVVEHAAALDEEDTLVVVTHGAAIGAGISALLGLDAGEWNGVTGVGNCHWSVLHAARSGRPAWRLAQHNVGATG
ncbi:MAG TPA: histidine phosphatase family protein [Actinotalea caeni]|uniref:histidine phosphatase family protein n=1 Tax=Actinotalea caeni TaxID=1348467 RepID=UPI00187858AD|nr:histidine phosphatase family protein [Actinotalea caeni]HLV55237.1 histidine phosphatase family protein [Actinotalea caeni]